MNTADLATARCALATDPQSGWLGPDGRVCATWHRQGLLAQVQVDNDMIFCGSPAYPRGMGLLIRVCPAQRIEHWFIPLRESRRNGVMEKLSTIAAAPSS